jgi:predicted DsbA family dithiol-disulfide isomerase
MSEAVEIPTIEIVSNVVCPWCFADEKRLKAALKDEAGPVAVRWRPYQFDPTIPERGLDRVAAL